MNFINSCGILRNDEGQSEYTSYCRARETGALDRAADLAQRGAKAERAISNLLDLASSGILAVAQVAERLAASNPVREVLPPKPEKPAIVPLSQADVRMLLTACERSRAYSRPGKRISDHARPTALRDKTIILLLLDTGIRASELCGITALDVDLKNRRIVVMGKGDKGRTLPISAETAKSLWRYMSARQDAPAREPLFASQAGGPLDRQALLALLVDLGKRAGVNDVHPHRFRHTFAITFLRNGGNVYELQMALGHTTMEMVRTYLALAETDLQRAHEEASPVTNWRLRG